MRVVLRTARWFVLSSVSLRDRRRLRRLARRWPSALCASLAALFITYLSCWAPHAYANWAGQADLRRRAAAAAEEGVSYDLVRRAPGRHSGRTVRWHMLRRGDRWYYRGDAARPVDWLGAAPDLMTGERHAVAVVATVADAERGGVRLAFEGFDEGLSLTRLLLF